MARSALFSGALRWLPCRNWISKMPEASMSATPHLARLLLLVSAGAALGGGRPARAQHFSADLVRKQGNTERAPAGRLFVVGAKVRIETPDLSGGFLLIDGAAPTAYFVRPAMRVYMDARQ